MRIRKTLVTGALAVGTAALFGVMLATLVRYAPDPSTTQSPDARNLEVELAEFSPDVVILGNSMAGAAIDDEGLTARLGMPATTLSVAHSQLPVWYAILKNRVYANGYSPKLILIPATLFDILGLSQGDRQSMTRLADQLTDDEPVIDAKVMSKAGSGFLARRIQRQEALRRWLTYLVPSLVNGALFGDASKGAVHRRGRAVTEEALGRVFHESEVDFGANAPAPRFTKPDEDAVAMLPSVEDSLVPDLLDLAEAHGSKVVFIRVPVAPGNQDADPVSLEQAREFVEYLNSRGAGYLDLWNMTLRPSDFQDQVHLDSSGRSRVTRQLGTALSQWQMAGGFEVPEAPKPRIPPKVTRIGEVPHPFPIFLEPTGAEDCTHQATVPALADFSDSKLSLVGLSGTAPFLVYQGERELQRRDDEQESCYEGHFEFVDETIRLTPYADGARQFTLRVMSDDQMAGASFGRPAQWVFPGTTLRYEFEEPWVPAVDGPFTVSVAAQPFGNGRGRPEINIDGRAGAPLVGHGGRLQARVVRKAPEAPWAVEISSPGNGPFLALQALAIGDEPNRNLVVSARYKSESPMVQVVGRDIQETAVEWAGPPPRLPPNLSHPRLTGTDNGTGQFRVPALAHISDTTTTRCSPVTVLEDGKPLRRRHSTCHQVRNAPGSMCHARNTIVFNASDGTDPLTNGRDYSLGFTRMGGKFCLTELWVFPGDTMRVSMGPGDMRGLFAGANMLELSGVVGSYEPGNPSLWVGLTVDGTEIVNQQIPADALNYSAMVIPLNPPVPPVAQSVVLTITVPEDGPHVLLRNAVLTEMNADERARAYTRWQRWLRWKKRGGAP